MYETVVARSLPNDRDAQVRLVVPVSVPVMHAQVPDAPAQLVGTATHDAVVAPPVVTIAQYWVLNEHCDAGAVLLARHSKVAPPLPSSPQWATSAEREKNARNLMERIVMYLSKVGSIG